MKGRLCAGHDLILLAFPETEKPPKAVTLSEKAGQFEFLFKKAGLLK
jgi:hypothetical protein